MLRPLSCLFIASIPLLLTGAAAAQAPAPGPARVAFLAPAGGAPHNIYLADPETLAPPQQITFSESGVYDFGVSPDGRQIVFAERSPAANAYDLRRLWLEDGRVEALLDCGGDRCTTPVWSPDGAWIAFERVEAGAGLPRLWLLDMTGDGRAPAPLFADETIFSQAAVWSPDGRWLASYDTQNSGILLVDMSGGDIAFLPSLNGSPGAFSPDSQRLAFPDVVIAADESALSNHLKIADLATGAVAPLGSLNEPVDDERAVWMPDGQSLIVGRRYLDSRYTPGRQLYLVAAATGDTKPLVVDERYFHGYFAWDPTATRLVIQRFRQPEGGAGSAPITPELWVYDTTDQALIKLTTDAFLPQWVP